MDPAFAQVCVKINLTSFVDYDVFRRREIGETYQKLQKILVLIQRVRTVLLWAIENS